MIESHDPELSEPNRRDGPRARILAAAMDLLASGGRDAVTTRTVAAAAGVQAPTLYRLFGDKSGLLDAVAEYGFGLYLREKEIRTPGPDPVEDLRKGWDSHIEFGLTSPAIYRLMYGDPRPGGAPPVAVTARKILHEHIHRIARAGRLRVSEARAASMVHASGCGTVLTLLEMPEEERDLGLSVAAREATLAAIASDAPAEASSGLVTSVVALRAALTEATVLSQAERALLGEWLDRLARDEKDGLSPASSQGEA